VMTPRWRLVNGQELYAIGDDPGQQEDVARSHPEVVAKLRTAYDEWWGSLQSAFEQVVRIEVGGERENPTRLMSHDWLMPGETHAVWNQQQVRQGMVANGPWALQVAAPGSYTITLYRWPAHLERPMGCVRARIAIGEIEQSQSLESEATEARFQVTLPEGPAELTTTLVREDGTEHGAYFVHVERLE
jgi:hypothetical protein